MKWVGQALCYFGLYMIWSGTLATRDWGGGGYDFNFGLVAIGVAFILPGLVVLSGAVKKVDAHNESTAAQIFRTLQHQVMFPANQDPIPPFALYLRPFEISGMMNLPSEHMNMFDWDQYARPGQDSFERLVAEAIGPTMTAIGLGGGSEKVVGGVGLGGLFPNWQELILKALQATMYVFVVPGKNEGTAWEIRQIVEGGYLSKTVFLMPPCHGSNVDGYRSAWSAAAERFKSELGLTLPEYTEKGSLFSIDAANLRHSSLVPFKLTPRGVAQGIERVRQTLTSKKVGETLAS